jgi:hypothetical protein
VTFYAGEEDRWADAYERELEREAEQREAAELAARERLAEKGWPHRPLEPGRYQSRETELRCGAPRLQPACSGPE